jgi:hypothetical protein
MKIIENYKKSRSNFRITSKKVHNTFLSIAKRQIKQGKYFDAIATMERCPIEKTQKAIANIINKLPKMCYVR